MRRIAVITGVAGALLAPVALAARPAARTIAVNERSSGRTFHVHVGDRIRVRLPGASSGGYDLPMSSGRVLALVSASGGYPTGHPGRALFAARHRGAATITAETDYPCLHATPRCLLAQRVWMVRVVAAR